MAYDFENSLSKDEKKYGIGGSGGYFNIEPGNQNVCRILTPGEVRAQHFGGKGAKPTTCYGYEEGCPIREKEDKFEHPRPSIQYLMYVIDRSDEQIKVAQFPYSVMKQIASLQKNPDYAFEDLPMPYDIRITKTGQGTSTEYKVDVKPNGLAVTPEQQNELNEKMLNNSPEQMVTKAKEKQKDADLEAGVWVSPTALQKERDNRMSEFKAGISVQENKTVKKELAIEYPTDDINPEDIPF